MPAAMCCARIVSNNQPQLAMIWNAASSAALFLVLLRFLTSGLILAVALRAAFSGNRQASSSELAEGREARNYLLLSLSTALLVLSLTAWPLFYLFLRSYVPHWPGVMCVYGVTRIGSGSQGLAGILPTLVRTVELLKPAAIFAAGAWYLLHRINLGSQTSPHARRLVAMSFALGTICLFESAAEGAYLLIPKSELHLAAGCCTGFDPAQSASKFQPSSLFGPQIMDLFPAFHHFAVTIWSACLFVAFRRGSDRLGSGSWIGLSVGSALMLGFNALQFTYVAAPIILHQPDHCCPYDLMDAAPESLLAAVLFFSSAFCVGWGAIVRFLSRHDESREASQRVADRCLFWAGLLQVSATAITSLEMLFA